MAAWNVCMMLKFRPLSTFFRTPVLFQKQDDKVTGVLLKLNRPKKPLSGFLRFCLKNRSELEAKYPDRSMVELTKIASKIWGEMPEKEKSQYNLEFAMEMEEFKIRQNTFLKELETYKYKNEWKKGSKKITEADKKIMGKPSQPKVSFLSFCSFLKKSSPGLTKEELFNKAKEKWKSIDDKDMKKFEEEISKANEDYEKQLLKWEQNMYNKGYFQLVRPEILKIFQSG